mmetsp:Transcript_7745/g.15839  ORF Transcript_7745/g.15839 Transcript_7745/m.15839 type:complete len:346 (-) Transcript_7745:498-1535(-)|eukprot:CAMPEP_0171329274 /NCGR_PEP_ID=MMETSP0878-20121228/1170_1 /TAXON_ID=67004 /ORGANISM="Thalassiosira weissflogii, Strain CCMP1336" /LENGTH=345 /DNA_ID=CAMNT_0011829237 /DNA_START=91 /DNA_END=1128 /DNA_ORIENTATION=-
MDLTSITATASSLFLTLLKYYSLSVFVFPLASVYQERRIWNPSPRLPSLSFQAHVKIYFFNVVWMGITLLGGMLLLPKALLGFDASYEAHLVERFTGTICTYLFLDSSIVVRGTENLPPESTTLGRCPPPAPVYIANHASQIDLAVVYLLNKRFKWISKDSVRFLPGVGLIMTLSRHVFINRRTGKNKSSVSNLYRQSEMAIKSGLPMFFFPQGTRRMDVRLPFKDGAYKVALENESEIVPISIEIPLGIWDRWYPLSLIWGGAKKGKGSGREHDEEKGKIVLTIHERIKVTKDMDREELKKKTFDVIYSVLPVIGEGRAEEIKGETDKTPIDEKEEKNEEKKDK